MAGVPWELKNPNVIGVKLTGKLKVFPTCFDSFLSSCCVLTYVVVYASAASHVLT